MRPVARQILALRQRQAVLMGAANYADFKLTDTMAQTRDRVWALLDAVWVRALPALASERVAGHRIAIFRGDGGRELLAETLRERGAAVDCIPCYCRSGPSLGVTPLLAKWRAGQLDALTVSSSEGLRYLVDLLDAEGRAYLQKTPVFVPHARIADNARALGLQHILLTEAADAGILAGLCAYNWTA